jgi:hypothetical protein
MSGTPEFFPPKVSIRVMAYEIGTPAIIAEIKEASDLVARVELVGGSIHDVEVTKPDSPLSDDAWAARVETWISGIYKRHSQ